METAPLGILVKHDLGAASGGTFNLDPDLDHLEVHFGGADSFFPDVPTLIGKLPATNGMMQNGIPAVGTFPIDQVQPGFVKVIAVDRAGNRSIASEAVPCTPRLLKDEYIDSLTVSKLTAGTITARTVLAAEMEVASGGNLKLTDGSLDVYDNHGRKKVEAGKLSDGSYGLAAVNPAGELTKLSDLIFGPRSAYDTSADSTSSTSYAALGGPSVDVIVGETGRLEVTFGCQMDWSQTGVAANTYSNNGGRMSIEMAGANTKPPANEHSLVFFEQILMVSSAQGIVVGRRASYTHFFEGLTPGPTTVTAMYSSVFPGRPVSFSDRTLIVKPY